MKIYLSAENLSLWRNFILVMELITIINLMKTHKCDESSPLRWKFIAVIQIYQCDEIKSKGRKLINISVIQWYQCYLIKVMKFFSVIKIDQSYNDLSLWWCAVFSLIWSDQLTKSSCCLPFWCFILWWNLGAKVCYFKLVIWGRIVIWINFSFVSYLVFCHFGTCPGGWWVVANQD